MYDKIEDGVDQAKEELQKALDKLDGEMKDLRNMVAAEKRKARTIFQQVPRWARWALAVGGAFISLLLVTSAYATENTVYVGSKCDIAWQANPVSENVDQYDIRIQPNGHAYVTSDTSMSCEEAGLDTSVAGAYVIGARAHNDAGWSDTTSAVVQVVSAPQVPSAPRGLTTITIAIAVEVK